jgi:hypothetical protein
MEQKKYCCERFAEAVKAKGIIHSDQNDETGMVHQRPLAHILLLILWGKREGERVGTI